MEGVTGDGAANKICEMLEYADSKVPISSQLNTLEDDIIKSTADYSMLITQREPSVRTSTILDQNQQYPIHSHERRLEGGPCRLSHRALCTSVEISNNKLCIEPKCMIAREGGSSEFGVSYAHCQYNADANNHVRGSTDQHKPRSQPILGSWLNAEIVSGTDIHESPEEKIRNPSVRLSISEESAMTDSDNRSDTMDSHDNLRRVEKPTGNAKDVPEKEQKGAERTIKESVNNIDIMKRPTRQPDPYYDGTNYLENLAQCESSLQLPMETEPIDTVKLENPKRSPTEWARGLTDEQTQMYFFVQYVSRKVRKGLVPLAEAKSRKILEALETYVSRQWYCYIDKGQTSKELSSNIAKFVQRCCQIFQDFDAVEAYILACKRCNVTEEKRLSQEEVNIRGNRIMMRGWLESVVREHELDEIVDIEDLELLLKYRLIHEVQQALEQILKDMKRRTLAEIKEIDIQEVSDDAMVLSDSSGEVILSRCKPGSEMVLFPEQMHRRGADTQNLHKVTLDTSDSIDGISPRISNRGVPNTTPQPIKIEDHREDDGLQKLLEDELDTWESSHDMAPILEKEEIPKHEKNEDCGRGKGTHNILEDRLDTYKVSSQGSYVHSTKRLQSTDDMSPNRSTMVSSNTLQGKERHNQLDAMYISGSKVGGYCGTPKDKSASPLSEGNSMESLASSVDLPLKAIVSAEDNINAGDAHKECSLSTKEFDSDEDVEWEDGQYRPEPCGNIYPTATFGQKKLVLEGNRHVSNPDFQNSKCPSMDYNEGNQEKERSSKLDHLKKSISNPRAAEQAKALNIIVRNTENNVQRLPKETDLHYRLEPLSTSVKRLAKSKSGICGSYPYDGNTSTLTADMDQLHDRKVSEFSLILVRGELNRKSGTVMRGIAMCRELVKTALAVHYPLLRSE